MQTQQRVRYWRSLSLQLFLLVLLPLTLLLLLVAVGGSLLHQQAMRELVGERDERSARAAATAVSEQLEQRAAAVRGLAQRAAQMEEPAQALKDVAPLLPDFTEGIGLFGPDGTLLAASDSRQMWQLLLPELLLDGNSSGEAGFFFVPFASASERTLVVVASREGYTAAGAFAPSDLVRHALSRVFRGGETASAFVVTDTGEIIYQTGFLPDQGPAPLVLAPVLVIALLGLGSGRPADRTALAIP